MRYWFGCSGWGPGGGVVPRSEFPRGPRCSPLLVFRGSRPIEPGGRFVPRLLKTSSYRLCCSSVSSARIRSRSLRLTSPARGAMESQSCLVCSWLSRRYCSMCSRWTGVRFNSFCIREIKSPPGRRPHGGWEFRGGWTGCRKFSLTVNPPVTAPAAKITRAARMAFHAFTKSRPNGPAGPELCFPNQPRGNRESCWNRERWRPTHS